MQQAPRRTPNRRRLGLSFIETARQNVESNPCPVDVDETPNNEEWGVEGKLAPAAEASLSRGGTE